MIDLEAIEAIEQAATPGPWHAIVDYTSEHECAIGVDGVDDPIIEPSVFMSMKDAEFIAHARTDVPTLIQEVKDLREKLFTPEDMNLHSFDNIRNIADPIERGRRAGELLNSQQDVVNELAQIRREAIEIAHAEYGLAYAEIASQLGLPKGRISQITASASVIDDKEAE